MRFFLPDEYLQYVQINGVFEGFTSGEPGYIQFWKPNELEKINAECETDLNAPGFFGFASDGGGEMIAFNETGAVFRLPFIGMEPQYAIRIADSFDELVQKFEPPINRE